MYSTHTTVRLRKNLLERHPASSTPKIFVNLSIMLEDPSQITHWIPDIHEHINDEHDWHSSEIR